MNDDALQVEHLLRAIVRYTFSNHPMWSVSEMWKHINDAVYIMQKTGPLDEDTRHNIVLDEYWRCISSP